MKYNEKDIEFANQILTRRNELDNELVEAWMSNPLHVEMLKEFVAIREEYTNWDFEIIKGEERERLQRAITRRKKRQLVMRWSVAASVILCVALSALYLWNDSDWFFEQKFPQQAKWEQSKLAEVELILADGKRVPLGGSGRQIQDHGVSGIKDDSLQGLTYVQAKALDEKVTVVLYNTLKVPTGGFYQLELSDGTRVWLNAESELRFPVQFGTGEREVYLKGEAYFDVRKDVARRFIVHLKESNVTVLGTSFNIKAYGDEDYIYTTLVEGKVRFTSEKEHEEVTLRPGMQSVLNLKSGKTELKEVEVEQFTAWRQGRFVFPSTTLGDLMCQLKRWYDIDVVYLSPEAKGYEFRGAINRDMDLKNVLAIVEKTSNVVFDINGRTIKVTIKNE
ncbi:MAG: FecR domain-containing protein [Butyricimonas sp.]|nr:FecR domain-containing protein [Butyricimonas sp.]